MSKYHLWYTGRVLKKAESGNTILKQIDGDYMGSAEFEFGAVPTALANFLTSEEELVFNKVVRFKDVKDNSIAVLKENGWFE